MNNEYYYLEVKKIKTASNKEFIGIIIPYFNFNEYKVEDNTFSLYILEQDYIIENFPNSILEDIVIMENYEVQDERMKEKISLLNKEFYKEFILYLKLSEFFYNFNENKQKILKEIKEIKERENKISNSFKKELPSF